MHTAEREIGEVEIKIEELNAISGGRAMSADDAMAFRNALIK